MKIIVPNTTAGLVIGKAGATVKTIMDESGAKVSRKLVSWMLIWLLPEQTP